MEKKKPCMVDHPLISTDKLTQQVKSRGIFTWDQLTKAVEHLPYGRNSDRTKTELVWEENKGTCSSKHAFLQQIANANGIKNVQMILGIYKMTEENTPGIKNELTVNGISYIPEAHCYLKIKNIRQDFTHPQVDINRIEKDILEEIEIHPEQVGEFKIQYHQQFIKIWMGRESIKMSFDKLWAIREKCIVRLSEELNHNSVNTNKIVF